MKHQWVFDILPYLLPVISYLIMRRRPKIKLPASVRRVFEDPEIRELVDTIVFQVQAHLELTPEQRREHAFKAIRREAQAQLGKWLPDAVVNLLIEAAVNRMKGER